MPPRQRSLELELLEDEVLQMVQDLELYSYYQLLELEPSGSCAVAEYNYNVKVHHYRTVQQDQRCSAALYQALTLIMDRLEEAKQVLSDARLRREYDCGLESGQTRYLPVVRELAAQRNSGPRDERQEVLELLTARLQRTIHKELLQAPDVSIPDSSEGIEGDLLDRESRALTGELASYGVVIDIQEEVTEQPQPIDPKYLTQAAEDLRLKIYKDGATLYEISEREAISASADQDLVSGLAGQLRQELQSMGVPENELVETEDAVPEQAALERLAWQEQAALLDLQVDTAVKPDEPRPEPNLDLPAPIPIDLTEPLAPSAPRPIEQIKSPIDVERAAGAASSPQRADGESFDLVIPIEEELDSPKK